MRTACAVLTSANNRTYDDHALRYESVWNVKQDAMKAASADYFDAYFTANADASVSDSFHNSLWADGLRWLWETVAEAWTTVRDAWIDNFPQLGDNYTSPTDALFALLAEDEEQFEELMTPDVANANPFVDYQSAMAQAKASYDHNAAVMQSAYRAEQSDLTDEYLTATAAAKATYTTSISTAMTTFTTVNAEADTQMEDAATVNNAYHGVLPVTVESPQAVLLPVVPSSGAEEISTDYYQLGTPFYRRPIHGRLWGNGHVEETLYDKTINFSRIYLLAPSTTPELESIRRNDVEWKESPEYQEYIAELEKDRHKEIVTRDALVQPPAPKPIGTVTLGDMREFEKLGLVTRVSGNESRHGGGWLVSYSDVAIVTLPVDELYAMAYVYERVHERKKVVEEPNILNHYQRKMETIPEHYVLVSTHIVPLTASPKTIKSLASEVWQKDAERGAATGTFALHFIPLGAAVDYALRGEWKEAGISLASDAAMMVGLGFTSKAASLPRATHAAAKAAQAGSGALAQANRLVKSSQTARMFMRTAMGVEAGIAAVRLQDMVIHLGDGQYVQAAGNAGEALLRLLGIGATHLTYSHKMAEANAKIQRFDNLLERIDHRRSLVAKTVEGSSKGLIGKDFENFLTKNIGGSGAFTKGGREFDGGIGSRWWEAKSGNYWITINNPSGIQKFKSDMGHRLRIAQENNATYELFSNVPIPQVFKDYLNKKGIPFTELLD